MILLTRMGYPVVIRSKHFIEDPVEREERYRCVKARMDELCSNLGRNLGDQGIESAAVAPTLADGGSD
jgi:hypothetical protein